MTDTCPHHWELPTPNGPTVIGTCRLCLATREFSTFIADTESWRVAADRHPKAKRGAKPQLGPRRTP